MPAPLSNVTAPDRGRLSALGAQLREARKRQRVSAVAASEAAGISRVTLHRIERGEPNVAVGAWVAVAAVLGLELGLISPPPQDRVSAAASLPQSVRIDRYPQLHKLAWALPGLQELEPREALELYERNWRHVDVGSLTPEEADFIRAISAAFGSGRLLV